MEEWTKDDRVFIPYVAGLFDGEGWFSINRSKRKDHSRVYAYQVQAALTMREHRIILMLQDRFGGSIQGPKSVKEGWSATSRWVVGSSNLLVFAEFVYPYLIAKKKQCELAIRFQKITTLQANKPLNDTTYEQYVQSYLTMKSLNQKGVNKE